MPVRTPRFVVDCRWLGYSGVGRATTLLLDSLLPVAASAEWVLWGGTPDAATWAGAQRIPAHPPLGAGGQRDLFAVPGGSAVLFPHAVRPLVARRSTVVVVHDTIPIRWATSGAQRRLWRAFLRRSARHAGAVVVPSEATARRVAEDLGVAGARVVRWPVDTAAAARRRALRTETAGGPPRAVYLGQVKAHKNLDRAVAGFARSAFARDGGVLTLVAGGAREPGALQQVRKAVEAAGAAGARVELVGPLDEPSLDRLLASAAMLLQPSLEEGYGLPVVEALAAGVPVCCSDIEPLREVAAGRATFFDPHSVDAVADAIDRTAAGAPGGSEPRPPELPTPAEVGALVLAALEEVAAEAGSKGR